VIHYKDMAFCVSPGCRNKCGRKLTDEVRAAAKRWGGEDAPISMVLFCDDDGETFTSKEHPHDRP